MRKILAGVLFGLLWLQAAVAQTVNPPVIPPNSTVPNAVTYVVLVTGGTDNAPAINTAINSMVGVGGGTVQLACGGTQTNPFYFSQIVLFSNIYIRGCGIYGTYLKQLASQNKAAVIGPSNFASLVGTNTPNGGTTIIGLQNFGLQDMTIDGNYGNNTNADCADLYGRYIRLHRLKLTNCSGNGLWTEWGPGYAGPPTTPVTFDNGLEATFDTVHIWNTGKEGIHFNGPHDSFFNGVIVAGASQLSSGTYDGVYIGQQGNARFVNLHQYALSSLVQSKCGVDVESAGNDFSASHFEGANIPLYIGNGTDCYGTVTAGFFGQNNFDASNQYYNARANGGPQVVIRSPLNQIQGLVNCGFLPTTLGIQLGQGSDNPTANSIDVEATSCNSGTLALNEPGGTTNNFIKINAFQVGGPGYTGTFSTTDSVLFAANGSASNSLFSQNWPPLNALYVGGSTYGQAQTSLTCTGSARTCFLSTANSTGVGTDPSDMNITANGTGSINIKVGGLGNIGGYINNVNMFAWSSTRGLTSVPFVLPTYTIAGLPSCASGIFGSIANLVDTVASAAPTWHAAVTGGGATTVHSLVSCQTTGWQYE